MPARTVRSTPSTARVWPKTLTRPDVCMARVGWGSNAVDILSLQRSGIRILAKRNPGNGRRPGGVPDSLAQRNVPPMPMISSKNTPERVTIRTTFL
jgi:hypothetical protein